MSMKHDVYTMTKNQNYKGFTVLDCKELPEYDALGIWLKHKKTGLEVFHMACDDKENLFAFSFATPPTDSTGVAHILEHSVLCGSKKYPLKDPFIQLSNQSVKTFLNAMTFSDKTVYPAATVSEKDYFNLMSVYGDAVFFPLLQEWTFQQEGHRLEVDEKGTVSIQGVVYNEMKGNYSSFEGVAADYSVSGVLPNTIYDVDSGGSPEEIPLLTYENFVDFHKNHYTPSNCKVFLYGNISTEKQLDFIQREFLDEFEKNNYVPIDTKEIDRKKALEKGRIPWNEAPRAFDSPLFLEKAAPAGEGDTRGEMVTLSWFVGDSSDPLTSMEATLLAYILMNHDGSPMTRALLESGLGEDLSPNCGIDGEMHWLVFNIGLRGVEKGKAQQVEKLIMEVLENLCNTGISKEDIEATLLSFDFSQREVKRSGGPYSLVLMRKTLRKWLYGKSPFEGLKFLETLKEIEENILSNPDYLVSLVKRMLLHNKHRVLVAVRPDEDYGKRAAEKEQLLLNTLLKTQSLETIKLRQEALHRIQQLEDDPSVLPHLSLEDLPTDIDFIQTERKYIDSVPVFINEEATKGIIYGTVGFPVDNLTPEEYKLLPFFCNVVTSVGFGGQSWVDTALRDALCTGGFAAHLVTAPFEESEGTTKNDPTLDRDWLFFSVKMLQKHTKEALNLVKDCLMSPDFSDKKRIQDLAREYRNDFLSSILPLGHNYVASRVGRFLSRSKTVDEIWNGFSQLETALSFAEAEKELQEVFVSLFEKIKSAGTIIHVVADKESLESAMPYWETFIRECKFHAPQNQVKTSWENLLKATELETGKTEVFCCNAQIGFAATACTCDMKDSRKASYGKLLSHWLTNTVLWEQIRTVGGAYGAFCWSDFLDGLFSFATYRDPKPFTSLEIFNHSIETLLKKGLTESELEKLITGVYSKQIEPKSPSGRGQAGLLRSLYGFSYEKLQERLQVLLSTKPKDVLEFAENIREKLNTAVHRAVICNKSAIKQELNDSKVFKLPV